jgi:hypothetical protein
MREAIIGHQRPSSPRTERQQEAAEDEGGYKVGQVMRPDEGDDDEEQRDDGDAPVTDAEPPEGADGRGRLVGERAAHRAARDVGEAGGTQLAVNLDGRT